MHVWKATYVETTINGRNLGQKVEARKLPLLSVVQMRKMIVHKRQQ
jgi:hypothetical protein